MNYNLVYKVNQKQNQMSTNTFSELKKINGFYFSYINKREKNNSNIIMERNNFDKENKSYSHKRFSEFLRFETEFNMICSFLELIFLELFTRNQIFYDFNLLLHQTMELLVCKFRLSDTNNIILRFSKITSKNLVNPNILIKFTSINNSLLEAKGFLDDNKSMRKKSYTESDSKEFFSVTLEKIRIISDNKNFLVSEVLINNLFRIKTWYFLRDEEKRVFSEQILRILENTQNLILLAKFYYIKFEYNNSDFKNQKVIKVYIFLSFLFYCLTTRSNSTLTIQKLLKAKITILFNLDFYDFFKDKSLKIIKSVCKSENFRKKFDNLIPITSKNFFVIIGKSFIANIIQENIQTIPRLYQSIIISNIKNWLILDTRDIEYYILTYIGDKHTSISIDDLRGILYLNLKY